MGPPDRVLCVMKLGQSNLDLARADLEAVVCAEGVHGGVKCGGGDLSFRYQFGCQVQWGKLFSLYASRCSPND